MTIEPALPSLSIADIVGVLNYGSSAIDAPFQFWITVTFAAILVGTITTMGFFFIHASQETPDD
jgi:hypothetical protein